jgi:hypothetical protein
MVVRSYNLSTLEDKLGESEVENQLGIQSEFEASWGSIVRPFL